MPAIAFGDVDANLDPTPAWRFYATLPSIPGSTLDGQLLSFYVERMSAPMPGINFEPAAFNSGERQFPNMRTIDVINMTLAEDTNYSVIQYLRAWKNLVIDDDGNYGLPAAYKMPISIQPLDFQGNSRITLSWLHCSPSRIDSLDFDGSATRHVAASVSFVVDEMAPLSPTGANTNPSVGVFGLGGVLSILSPALSIIQSFLP